MMGVCKRYARTKADADDIFQESMMNVFHRLHQLKEIERIEGWAKRIVVNEAIRYYRKNRIINYVENIEVISQSQISNENISTQLEAKQLLKLIQELPNKMRLVINLFAIEGYKQEKFAFSGGLELVYPINPIWSIYSGIKLSEYRRKTTNDLSHLKDINGLIAAPTSAGDILIHGLATNQLSSQNSFQTEWKFQSLEIPLILRYQTSKGIYFDGGFIYSYLFADKTKTSLTGSDLPFSYNQISGIRKNNLGLKIGGGYTLVTGSGLKFDFGPEICLNLTAINPGSDLMNRPLVLGFRTALSLQRFQKN